MQVTRTYLELVDRTAAPPVAGLSVIQVDRPEPPAYRRWYREVGEAYRWTDRAGWTDAEIAAHLARSDSSFYLASAGGREAGWYELRRVPGDGSVEIVYFGLFPHAVGQGLGRALLERAVADAWRLGATRIWVHTCTLDHPAALPNYLGRGFTVFKTETYAVAG